MKLVRFREGSTTLCGVLKGETIQVIDGDVFGSYRVTERSVSLANVKLLAPCSPSKAVCVGLNYHDHAKEMKLELPAEPLIFLKPATCLLDPEGAIEYPAISQNLHFEAELAVVIKKQAKKVAAADAADYILGYTCANDVTARDLQKKDGQWTRSKAFDTFMPLGPCIETEVDAGNAGIKLYLNGEVKQSSNTSNLIFKIPELMAFITQVMTLYPGDVILTGTSSGVGPMEVGDTVSVEVEGIGRLNNTVVKG